MPGRAPLSTRLSLLTARMQTPAQTPVRELVVGRERCRRVVGFAPGLLRCRCYAHGAWHGVRCTMRACGGHSQPTSQPAVPQLPWRSGVRRRPQRRRPTLHRRRTSTRRLVRVDAGCCSAAWWARQAAAAAWPNITPPLLSCTACLAAGLAASSRLRHRSIPLALPRCAGEKYHVICSLGSGVYTEWQSRVVGGTAFSCACWCS